MSNVAPRFVTLLSRSVIEDVQGARIGILVATDANWNDTITFTVDDSRFEVVTTAQGLPILALKSGISLDYETASSVPVLITATDSGGLSTTRSFNIAVINVNDAPTATTSGGTVPFAEDGSAVAVDPGLTLRDPDSTTLTGATVRITGNYVSSEDLLAFTNTASITGSWNETTGTLTLSGSASLAAYQAALRSVTYENTNEINPSTVPRTISFQVNDGRAVNNLSNVATRDVTVATVNDAPGVTTSDGSTSYTEGSTAVQIDAALTVADLDDTDLEGAAVRITTGFEAGDTLTFVDTANITGDYDPDTGVLTLTGTDTLANYQAALRSITFSSASNNPGTSKTVEWTVNDGDTDSTAATKSISITPVNEAPQVALGGSSGPSATLDYTENNPASVIAPAATVSDADSPNFAGGSLTVAFTANGTPDDQLGILNQGTGAGQIGVSGTDVTFEGTTIGAISGGVNGADLVISFNAAATPAAAEALVRNITYATTSDTPSTSPRTVSFTVVDGDGGSQTGVANATVNVTAANDAPVVSAGGTLSYTENGAASAVNAGVTVTDGDSTSLTGATVSITGNYQSGRTSSASSTPPASRATLIPARAY